MDFNRTKEKLFVWRVSYLIKRLLVMILGVRLVTRLLLNLSWVSTRLAFESCADLFRDDFRSQALGLDQNKMLELISSTDTILDIGCGYGAWSEFLALHAKHVVGIDYDSNKIDYARKRKSNATFLLLDARSNLSELGNFDKILLSHVLEHIDKPSELLKELSKISKALIIEVPDRESNPLNWARVSLGLQYYTDADHVREFSRLELEKLLSDSGWHDFDSSRSGGSLLVVARKIS